MSSIKAMIHWSRSRRAVMCSSAAKGSGGEGTSCWSNLPLELLREVLVRIEESESSWPVRKNVVACAGVCRGWRHIIIELVKVPELSGKLTFPISVKQPGPRDFLLQCFIRRCRSTNTYYLYLGLGNELAANGKFLLAAKKCRRATCNDYAICLDADNLSKRSNNCIGRLRSNFIGTKFTVIDRQPLHAGAKMSKCGSMRLVNLKQFSRKVTTVNHPVASISYELSMWGSRSRGPRKMHCTMDTILASAIEPGGKTPTQTEFTHQDGDFIPPGLFFWSKSKHSNKFQSGPFISHKDVDGALVLKNKAPRWHEHLQCWCLNFHGRVTIASVKNFQLVASPENQPAGPEHDKIILQFGRVGKDLFTMDYRYPLSAFQAFAICLSSFDTRIACE